MHTGGRFIGITARFVFVFAFIILNSSFIIAKTHVFWYNALKKGYHLADCNPGPCLPKDALIHEGKVATRSWDMRNGLGSKNIKLSNVPAINERVSSYFWSQDLNCIGKGKAKSAKLCAEYKDGWGEGSALCIGGSLLIRCGVADFSRNIAAFGGVEKMPAEVPWADTINTLSDSIGFDAGTNKLQAEEIKEIRIPEGKRSPSSPGKLNGKFFEIDITRQVNWIIAHHGGQYGIFFVVEGNAKNTGKVFTYSYEDLLPSEQLPDEKSWTRDANTCNVIIEENRGNPLVFVAGESAAKPNTPEGITWAFPKPYSVIRSDTIKIGLEVQGKRTVDNVRRVDFYATYANKKDSLCIDSLLGSASLPPYEIAWKCNGIPDQNLGKLSLGCSIIRKDGNDSTISLKQFVLDRNPLVQNARLRSVESRKPVTVDGRPDEWRIGGSKKKIAVFSQWDRDFFYLLVEVQDTNVWSRFPPKAPNWEGIYEDDDVEIFLDPHHAHLEIMDTTCRQFLIAAAGMTQMVTWNREKSAIDVDPEAKTTVRVLGTLNHAGDRDTGYIVECAFPWKILGAYPAPDMAMGLEVWNTDIDSLGKKPHYVSWSGTKPGNLHNPSEWNSVVLEEGRGAFWAWLVAVIAALFFLSAGLFVIRQRKLHGPATRVEPGGAARESLEDRVKKAEELLAAMAHAVGDKGEYLQKLEQSNAELEQFARVASHDLQEPLRKIQAFGDRLTVQMGEQMDTRSKEYLSRMQDASTRMRSLIDGLLALSRVTSRAEPFKKVELAKVVLEVVSDLQVRIEEKKGAIECGTLPEIEADPMQIRQLFQNLIGNALKFSKEGTNPVIKINAKPVAAGEEGPLQHWEITVSDNGIGFEEEHANRIFEAFVRLQTRDKYEGTGLGLSICKKIVERHQGKIIAKSKPGVGTAFIITLPEKQMPAPHQEPATATVREKEEIARAKAFIENHYKESDLSREIVAGHVGLNPDYFGRSFRKETNEGFLDYLNTYRIDKAKKVLLETQLKVTDVAFEVGFSNIEHFVRTFKKLNGISPTEFREKTQDI